MLQALLRKADLSGARLNEANLNEAMLNGARLNGADLSRSTLNKADLSEAELSCANLSRADLIGTNLDEANLSEAELSGANLGRTNLENALSLKDTDLRGASVKRLMRGQLEACKAKGAIIDEDATTSSHQPNVAPSPSLQSNDAQAPPAPPA